MIQKRTLAAVGIAVLALIPAGTRAQRMAGAIRVTPRPVTAAVPAAHRTPQNGIRTSVRTHVLDRGTMNSGQPAVQHRADGFTTTGGYPLSVQDLLSITPDSGFNWQYVNAINQDLPTKALIDPVTQLQVAQAERLLRLTGGSFPATGGLYYVPSETDEEPPVEQTQPSGSEPYRPPSQPQVIVVQQEPAQSGAAQPLPQTSAEIPTRQEMADRDGLVLVLRRGKQIEVAAFTRVKDRIVYVTGGGLPISIAISDLDSSATVRINRERGTMLELPSATN